MSSSTQPITDQQLQLFLQVELAKEHFNTVMTERSKLWAKHFYDYFMSSLKNFLKNTTPQEEEEIKKFILKHIIPSVYVDFLTERVFYIVQLNLSKEKKKSEMPTEVFYQFSLTPENLLLPSWEEHQKHLNEKINEFAEKIKEVTESILEKEKKDKKNWLLRVWKWITKLFRRKNNTNE